MLDRDQHIGEFLDAAGWGAARRRPLIGDASFRRYEFLEKGGRRAVLMDAPPEHEDTRPFVAMARHLAGLGYSVPRIDAADADAGLLVLEDLGRDTYTRLLDRGEDPEPLYGLAVDLLIDLHRRPAAEAIPDGLAPYDDGLLVKEALLFTDWYLPAMTGRPTDRDTRDACARAWRSVFPRIRETPPTLVLRDYHVDNLLRLPGRPGIAACGLLDFQDAVAGSTAYDLVSLLQDARRDVDEGLARRMLDRYGAAFPAMDRPAFEAAYAILGAQRHMKVIGLFIRLCRRDGKSRYLAHLPRLWRLLETDLRHPALEPVARWLDDRVPAAWRGVPVAAQ